MGKCVEMTITECTLEGFLEYMQTCTNVLKIQFNIVHLFINYFMMKKSSCKNCKTSSIKTERFDIE